jgi:hypothetical protein
MKQTASPGQPRFNAATRWAARLALFALVFQIAALGHWGGGRVSPAEQARHAQHCHGETMACSGGLSSAVSDLVPVAALPRAPLAQTQPTDLEATVLTGAFIVTPIEPPRAV